MIVGLHWYSGRAYPSLETQAFPHPLHLSLIIYPLTMKLINRAWLLISAWCLWLVYSWLEARGLCPTLYTPGLMVWDTLSLEAQVLCHTLHLHGLEVQVPCYPPSEIESARTPIASRIYQRFSHPNCISDLLEVYYALRVFLCAHFYFNIVCGCTF